MSNRIRIGTDVAKLLARNFRRSPAARRVFPMNSGRNGQKRRYRAAVATLRGVPGGWKKAVRQIQAEERARVAQ